MRSLTSDQRPSADGGATRRLLNTRARRRFPRRDAPSAAVKARSAWNVSLVMAPLQTRFHSASTVSAGIAAASRFVQRAEERGALVAQVVEDRGFRSATIP